MKVPKSKKAISVRQQAVISCKIWFVCKGHLICTRESCLDAPGSVQSPMASPSSRSSQSDKWSFSSSSQGQGESLNQHSTPMHDHLMAALPPRVPVRSSPQGKFSADKNVVDSWEVISRRIYQSLHHSSCSASDDVLNNSGSSSAPNNEESELRLARIPSMQKSDDDLQFLTPHSELDDMGEDTEIYHKLQQALQEAEYLKLEAYQESRRRQRAERDVVEAMRRAKEAENLYTKEARQRKETEETLSRRRIEVVMLQNEYDEILEQLQNANEHKLVLAARIADSEDVVADLEEKLSEAQYLIHSLQAEQEELHRERDGAVRGVEELRHRREQTIVCSHGATNCSEFSYSELEEATRGFSDALKIGEGGYGNVYKGFLRNTMVAIKVLNPESRQGQPEFNQEVDVLSKVRHPNLVTLIGVCLEAWAIIYEFLPNGSLEDHLTGKRNTPLLTWQARIRIVAEICSALIFLHSHKPHPVVHGDLKPDNILLDANLVSKLGDFGICRLLVQSEATTLFHSTLPKGTFVYIDPEFLSTGELTTSSDVYSFGVIILRLLTGRPAFGIAKEVHKAVEKGYFHGMVDASAGDWPFMEAKRLARLGLRCCEINRRNRPDLVSEVWPELECMCEAASLSLSPLSFGSGSDENIPIPNYFLCPILQEIMWDPHIAADGFTYEAGALRGWFDSGHDMSPMTNLKLPHCYLIPNRALRSAIQEWMQKQH